METPSNPYTDENPDFLPLAIKLIIVWLYLHAVLNLAGSFSFEKSGVVIDFTNILVGFLAVWSAYHLSYRRNFARIATIGIAIWSLISFVYVAWQMYVFWQETNRVGLLYVHMLGIEYTAATLYSYLILTSVMQIYTLVTLLHPKSRQLYIKPPSVTSI